VLEEEEGASSSRGARFVAAEVDLVDILSDCRGMCV
jgi:hypothetical protein